LTHSVVSTFNPLRQCITFFKVLKLTEWDIQGTTWPPMDYRFCHKHWTEWPHIPVWLIWSY